jgi:leucyl-tRNA synthetase
MWTKVLYDLNLIGFDEPYRKLVNQGMITGNSRFINRLIYVVHKHSRSYTIFFSENLLKEKTDEQLKSLLIKRVKYFEDIKQQDFSTWGFNRPHIKVEYVDGVELDIDRYRKSNPEFKDAIFICSDERIVLPTDEDQNGVFLCGAEIEKMSKSKLNVVNPDAIVAKYGADTFRMYEMFLGPVEMSKPWDTKGIEGVFRFLKKFWRLFVDEEKGLIVTEESAINEELKILHKTIKKIEEDTERFSFNTGVSAFMIATNELTDMRSHKRSILEPLLVLLASYAPHICEDLWHQLGHSTTILDESFPRFEEKYVKESSKTYPIAVNGKTRTEINIALDATQQQVEEIVLADETVKKWLEGRSPKKVIYVKNKMINLVV